MISTKILLLYGDVCTAEFSYWFVLGGQLAQFQSPEKPESHKLQKLKSQKINLISKKKMSPPDCKLQNKDLQVNILPESAD